MEDSSNALRRERPPNPHSNGDDSSPDIGTPKRSASSTDSINLLTTSVASMENLVPTMIPAAGSQDNLDTTPGSLSGLEEITSLVHGSCSSSEEVHESMDVPEERENPIAVSLSSPLATSLQVQDSSSDEEENQASIVNSGAMSSSHIDQEREHVPMEIIPLNSNEMEASLSENMEALFIDQQEPGSIENPDLTIREGQHSQGNQEEAGAGGEEVEERPEEAQAEGGGEVEEGEEVGGGGSHSRAITNNSDIVIKVTIDHERDLIRLTQSGENELGRPQRRLMRFSIINAAAQMVCFDDTRPGNLFISGMVLPFNGPESNIQIYCESFGPIRSWCITGFLEESHAIWVSTDIADYLCVKHETLYLPLYSQFIDKAFLCIQTFQELENDPALEMDLLLNHLVGILFDEWDGSRPFNAALMAVKCHLPFIADQLVGLDRRFSNFQAIETISAKFKDQVNKFEMLRQMNMMNGRKLSGSFYSIQDYNKKNHGECPQSSHKRSMTEASSSSSSTTPRCKEKCSIETNDTHERNLDTAPMDPQDIGEKTESEALSMTRTGDREAKRPSRILRGFEILDRREAMRPIEDSESYELYITSEIWPLQIANSNLEVRCEMFGEITSWCITGYNEGIPFIWVSTRVADYFCHEPNEGYMPFFKAFYEKAKLCILAFQILNKAPYMHFDEFLLKLVLSLMDCLRTFKEEEAARDYVNSQLGFVAQQLIELDMSVFSKLPVIKTIISKFNVNVGEAMNRKARHSFFSIDGKNEGRQVSSSPVIHESRREA
ncbi:DNA (cytosine-5)-methyltransferase 4-like [Amborella trichopoda]|uniref:DNA (cytosine-5)-methyltransferase 4-like n=1 Tax=Amborella trichopoda TaxID=13333 RepID=UPI0009BD76D0|nr:DNA (cytosine-5)-methyltransferase 4-like [Amborella trichopoda]|eukprot:XP_020527375.1 DNA (cytosine-5)-methyltransferase 4-like [Amborella trichopoda]